MSEMLTRISQMNTNTALVLLVIALIPLFYLALRPSRPAAIRALVFIIISIVLYVGANLMHIAFGYAVTLGVLPMYILGLVQLKSAASHKMSTKAIVFGAICVALGFILSCITLYHMPQGGSITPASMLPLIVYSYLFGPIPGIIAGIVYGLLQLIQDAYILHPVQVLLDYPLAFIMLGIAGMFRTKNLYFNLISGTVLACVGRFLCHFISGFVFFGSYAPAGQSPVVYSLLYNSFVFVDMIICLIILLLPPITQAIRRIKVSV